MVVVVQKGIQDCEGEQEPDESGMGTPTPVVSVPSSSQPPMENDDTVKEVTPEAGVLKKDIVVFPPPCSWYRSAASASRDEMWAYIAASVIVLVYPPDDKKTTSFNGAAAACPEEKGTNGNLSAISELKAKSNERDAAGRWPKFALIGPQMEKYNAISFCQSSWDYLPVVGAPLVSGCDRGIVRVWNLQEKSTVIYHDNHKGSPVMGVDWSPCDHTVIYAIDDKANMSVWNVVKNSLRSLNFGKVEPTCLKASPNEKSVVCFGTKGGNVFVVDVTDTTGKILAKVRHDQEVCFTAWMPKGDWGVLSLMRPDSKPKLPILVSSTHSMKLPTLRIWTKMGHDVGMVQAWDKDKMRPFKMFGTAVWAKDPNSGKLMLISSGPHGEIVAWIDGVTHEVLHMTHTHNAIFSIVQCGDMLWSFSYEPVIVGFNLRTMEVECVIPTFKGVCTMAPSPIDSSRLAIGGTDSVIRVLKCQPGYPTERDSCTKMPTITHKLKGRVTAMAWHPTRDNFIAFGTDEGVLGVFELKERNHLATTFNRRVSGTVYTVVFGPSVFTEGYVPPSQKEDDAAADKEPHGPDAKKEKTNDSLMLYVCGGQTISMINPSRPSNPLISVKNIIEKSNPPSTDGENFRTNQATDIVWAPDYSYFVVGYHDGRIDLYKPPYLKLKCWIKCHLRAIQYLTWRPFDFCKDQQSDTKWLVSASNDATTRLYNLAALYNHDAEDESKSHQEPMMIISSEATLKGHGVRVISCAWSPHDKNLLVTVAYDNTAIIWNLESGSYIGRYMEHQHRLVACSFHPTDPFKVISVSDELSTDFSVHLWDYREHPFRKTPPKTPGCKPANPIKAADETIRSLPVEEALQDVGVTDHGDIPIHPTGKATAGGERQRPKPKMKSLLPLTANGLINAKCAIIKELEWIMNKTPCSAADAATEADNPSVYLGVLGDSADCLKLVQVERQGHTAKKQLDHAATLSAWMGDRNWVEDAIKNRQVTETMLHIARMMSTKLYVQAVTVFAEQLIDNEEYARASTMFFAIGDLDRAVQVFVDQALYREAIALLKTCVPKEDERIPQVSKKWAQRAITDGNFELAAKIYCSIEQYSNAMAVIEKRSVPYAFQAGCYLASKTNDEKKLEMFGVKFVLDGIVRKAYKECEELITEYPGLKWLTTVIKVHECITGYTKYISEVKTPKDLDMWKMVMTNSLEAIRSHIFGIDLDKDLSSDRTKITRKILVSLAQTETDAQQIITKNLALLLMGTYDKEQAAEKAAEVVKLSTVWFAQKNPRLHYAVVIITYHILLDFKFSRVEEFGLQIPEGISAAQKKVMEALEASVKPEGDIETKTEESAPADTTSAAESSPNGTLTN